MNEWEKLLSEMQAATAGGMLTDEQADSVVRSVSKGQYQSLRQLEQQIAIHTVQKARGALKDYATAALQGVTLNGLDEGAGIAQRGLAGNPATAALGYALEKLHPSSANQAMDERLQQIEQQHPVGSRVAEFAGSMLLPVGGAAKAPELLGKGASTVLRAAGRAALPAGLLGAAQALGGSEDTSVGGLARDAAQGAAGGAAGGFLLGGALGAGRQYAAIRAARQMPAAQLADDLAQAAGVPGGELRALRGAARARTEAVSRELYRPLEQAFPVVQDEKIAALLQDEQIAPIARSVIKHEGPPTLPELQEVRKSLNDLARSRSLNNLERRRAKEAAGKLSAAMQDAVSGLQPADEAYRAAIAGEDFNRGAKLYPKHPEELRAAIEAAPDENAARTLRAGAVQREYVPLSRQGGTVTPELINRLLAPGKQDQLRNLFPSEAAYQSFLSELQRTGKALLTDAQLQKLKKLARIGIYGGGLLAGYKLSRRSLFDLQSSQQ